MTRVVSARGVAWTLCGALLMAPRSAVHAQDHISRQGHAEPIPADMRARMEGVTWRPGCPVGLDALSLLHIPHHDMDGNTQEGLLIVATSEAEAILAVFSQLYDAGFPIRSLRPAHEFDGSDDASMAADNTSGFNCRPIAGGRSFSQHSYGTAIDINTVENPYVRGTRVLPPAGTEFLDRSDVRPGMITQGDVVVRAFQEVGWKWGGNWQTTKDYQHFSATGR